MRKLRVIAVGAAMLLSAFFSSAAFAQDLVPGTFTFSPMIGGYFFEGDEHLHDTGVFGLGVGYMINRNIEAEFTFDGMAADGDRGRRDTGIYMMKIDGLYHFKPVWNVCSYIAAGAGTAIFTPDGLATRGYPLVDFGGGLEYFIIPDYLSARVDLRDILKFDPGYNDIMLTAGVKVYFGGKGSTAAAAALAPAPAAEAPAPAEQPQAQAGSTETCIMLKVNFDFDKSDIKPDFKDEVKKVADYLNDHPKSFGVVQGYTDAVGSDDYNMKLGLRRAEAVKQELVSQFGISADRLKVESFGKSHPLSTNLTEEGRAENRRAMRVFCSEGTRAAQVPKPATCLGLKVEFESGKWDVRAQYNDEIKRVADYMKEHPDLVGTIEGYTDNVGQDKLNMQLSLKRAEAVKQYLVNNFGISPDRLVTRGLG
ncbi:MAG: OmpA family protein [Nitrospirota bacterium]